MLARWCFNGAMAVRPWMARACLVDRRAAQLQWGHGREAMDGVRHGHSCLGGPRFNGAMAVRPWMEDIKAVATARANLLQWGHGREAMDGSMPRGSVTPGNSASMGPWP